MIPKLMEEISHPYVLYSELAIPEQEPKWSPKSSHLMMFIYYILT